MFLSLIEAFAKLAPMIDWVSKGLGSLSNGGDTKVATRTDALKRVMGGGDKEKEDKSPVSALQKIGAGGGFGGGDPLSGENQKQTSESKAIRSAIERMNGGGGKSEPVPV